MSGKELKVTIIVKDENIFLGAQASDCDPKITTLKGDLQAALDRIPSFVEESQKEWAVTPRNPKTTVPAPPPPVRTASTPVASKPKEKPAQPNFF